MMLYTYCLLLLICLVFGFYFFKRLHKSYKYLTILITITYILEISAIFYNKEISIDLLGLTNRTNFPIYHLLQPIQIIFIGLIYSLLFKKLSYYSQFYISITYFLTLITLIISFTIQPITDFPSYGSIIQSLFFVFSALLLFYSMLRTPTQTPILKQASFWFNSGNLFFYAITFIIYGYYQDFREHNLSTPNWANNTIACANFILYPCYLISILLNAKTNKNA